MLGSYGGSQAGDSELTVSCWISPYSIFSFLRGSVSFILASSKPICKILTLVMRLEKAK